MSEAFITAVAAGGRALAHPVDGSVWVSPERVATFADRHRKVLRYLNRGSVVTAALVDAALAQRWPDRDHHPDGLALVVGSAFGNQGETTRYFRSFAGGDPGTVSPMASYDVAINAFVSFCSIFFRCSGVVQTLSCGAVSGVDALTSGLALLAAGEAPAVVVVGVEHESPETSAYCSLSPEVEGGAESGVVMLLEPAAATTAVRGRLLAAETAFAPPWSGRTAAVLSALIGRVTAAAGVPRESVAFLTADPSWAEVDSVAHRAIGARDARWIDAAAVGGRWQIGSAGLIGGALLLESLMESDTCGLCVAADPCGWLGTALFGGGGECSLSRRRREEDLACPR